MYLLNKYTTWYNNIITQAQQRVNQTGYTEKHHILPKSLGGSNDQSNLVKLTAKEHFVCHRLLVRMTVGESKRKMANAAWGMANLRNLHQGARHKVNSITYAKLKSEYKKDPASIEKIRAKLKGRKRGPMSAKHKEKLRDRVITDEWRLNLSVSRIGKSWGYKHSNATKDKMSAWQKGIPKEKIRCEYCDKETSKMNNVRWHGLNCKHAITS